MAMNPISQDYAASSTGAQVPIGVDWRDSPNGFSYQVVFDAGASGSVTVDTTLDNLNAIPAPTPVWTSSAAITSTTSGFIGSPVQFIRLTVGSLSGGTITLKILEGAPDGGGDSSGTGGGASSNVNIAQVGGAAVTSPLPVTEKGAPTIATAQVSVANSSTQIVAARAGRAAVIITVVSAVDVYYGVTGVTTSTGALLLGTKGAAVTISTSAAIFGVVATGTATVTVTEVF